MGGGKPEGMGRATGKGEVKKEGRVLLDERGGGKGKDVLFRGLSMQGERCII